MSSGTQFCVWQPRCVGPYHLGHEERDAMTTSTVEKMAHGTAPG